MYKQQTPWFEYPNYKWVDKHAVIIGGGIAACQTAWHLCQLNWRVTLIERHDRISTEASGNPIGVILPKMTSQESIGEDFYTNCFNYTISQLQILKQQGKVIDWQQSGALQLTHNERELKRWNTLKKRTFQKDFLQLLNEAETSKQAGIKLPYKSSYFPQAGWIKPDSFCRALTDHPNCKTILKTEALNLEKSGINWKILDTSNNLIAKAEAIILCTGKNISLFQQSNFLPNMPVAGQTTLAKASDHSKNLKTVIGHEGYLTPSIENKHIFGATFERNNSEPKLSPEADIINQKQLSKYLNAFIQELSNFESAHTAVRVTTPDRFPYCGALPDNKFYKTYYHDLHQGKFYKKYPKAKYQDGLFLLGGLGSRGLTTSGLCAKELSALLDNKPQTSKILQNCHPARFIIKALKRKHPL